MNPPINKEPKVSVVIPLYNNARMIGGCLESLLPQDYPDYEVLVVDDGSSDRPEMVVKEYPVQLRKRPHLGISAARNHGIRTARGEIILIIDSDLKVPKDLIRKMLLPLKDRQTGVSWGWWDISNPDNLVAAFIHRGYEYFTRNVQDANFFWGYCIAFRKSLTDEIGFFDENIPLVEDVDFAYRVARAGYKIRLWREATVWHYFRDSLSGHLQRHFKTARHKFIYVRGTGKFTDQRGTGAEYVKLLLHLLLLFSLLTLPFTPWVFLVLLGLCLLSHLPMTAWSMKKGPKYILMLPFEFLTRIAWALGVLQGTWWMVRRYHPSPRDL